MSKARGKYIQGIIDKLRSGAIVHETMAHACARDEDAEAYHLEMANVMRAAAELLGTQDGEGAK